MYLDVLADWARTHPYPLGVLGVLAAVLGLVLHRVRRAAGHIPAAVRVAALGALVSTAYSADTSWKFARDHLDMTSLAERGIMFAAAELGLFAMAYMARANLNDPGKGTPGTPGVLVWVVTGVQVIPAYSESGIVAGTVRAFVGPIMAALLWHLAMGIELRHTSGGDSQALPAVIARELRERLLSRLGLAQRGRDAVQISRDRWTRTATVRAARLADLEASKAWACRLRRARRRLAAAVDRTDAGVLPEQRAVLLERIGAYRHASSLASITLPSPWDAPAPEVEIEPVPVLEVQPEPAHPVLAAVPEASTPDPEPVPDAETWIGPGPARRWPVPAAVPRLEVRAEYVPDPAEYAYPDASTPEEEPEDDSPPPPAEDNLTARARQDFQEDLTAGNAPSIRALKARYGVGQKRATRIKSEMEQAL